MRNAKPQASSFSIFLVTFMRYGRRRQKTADSSRGGLLALVATKTRRPTVHVVASVAELGCRFVPDMAERGVTGVGYVVGRR